MPPPEQSAGQNEPFQYTPPPPASPNPPAGQSPVYGAPGVPPPPGQGYPPPPGQGYPPPSSRRFPWWAFVLGGCGCLGFGMIILAAILFPVFSQAREKARAASCLSNQKQMALGVLMYTQDYDEKLPGSGHWMNDIESYLRGGGSETSASPFPVEHCPTASMRNDSIFGYAYDSRLNHKEMSSIASPRSTDMTYDSSSLAKNASDPFTSLPAPGRHEGRNMGSFLDGHAAALGTPSTSPGY